MSQNHPSNGLKLLPVLCMVLILAWAVFLIIAPEPAPVDETGRDATTEIRR